MRGRRSWRAWARERRAVLVVVSAVATVALLWWALGLWGAALGATVAVAALVYDLRGTR
jgi:hypothetical protein